MKSAYSHSVVSCICNRIILALSLTISILSPVHANVAAGWIESQARTDGTIATSTEPATAFQATVEALLALDWSGSSGVVLPAADYLAALPASTTESLARQAIIRIKAGQNADTLLERLVAAQNTDGGFGEAAGYQSTGLDTASALAALAAADRRGTTAASHAVQYLLWSQSADGGYRLDGDEVGSVYVTSAVVGVLSRYRVEYSVSSAISKAVEFIQAREKASGGWQNHWETASALLALAPVGTDVTQLVPASDALRAGQQADGSWEDSVYVTALAMRALQAVEGIPAPSAASEGVLSGRVSDSGSSLPVAGALVSAESGIEVITRIDGTFSITDLPPGSVTLTVFGGGYASATLTANVEAGGSTSLGNILLDPLPNTGSIRGVVTSLTDGMPLSGATVTAFGTTTVSTQTDEAGSFVLVTEPGVFSIAVNAGGFELASATGTVAEGSSLWFSPALRTAGTEVSAQTVTVQGSVVDDATGKALAAATVSIVAGSGQWEGITDSAGNFALEGIDAGAETILLTKDGYRSISYSAVAAEGGTVNLGTSRLIPETVPTSATIVGRVFDVDSDASVAGAEVRVEESGAVAVSAADGTYTIEDVAFSQFTLTTTAPGYAAASGSVQLAEFGLTNVDIALGRTAPVDFDVVRVETDARSYSALSRVSVVAVLGNAGTAARTVVLQVNVLNDAGKSVEQYPAVRIPMGGDPQDAWVTVEPGIEYPVPLEWNTDRYPPGHYRLVVDAVEASTGRLLAQRAGVVDIESTRRIGGSATFDPPIAQLAAKQPIQLTSLLSNRGNEQIDDATVSARVILEREGYGPRTDLAEVKTITKNQSLAHAKGMAAGPDGSFYVADSSASRILRIFPSGKMEIHAEDVIAPIDVDYAGGAVYALQGNGKIEVITADGKRESYSTGLSEVLSLKVLGGGRILIGARDGVYQRETDGQVLRISGLGLADPRGLAEINNGDLIIADSGQNALMRFSENRIRPFVEGINRPYGVVANEDGSLLVTAFGGNALYRVTADGHFSVLVDQLGGPYDVKPSEDGVVFVSNYNSNSIVSVMPDGTVSEVVGPTINQPTASTYDRAGTLYVANRGFDNIVQVNSLNEVSEFVNGIGHVLDMNVAVDGALEVLDLDGILKRVAVDGSVNVISRDLKNSHAFAPLKTNEWLVAHGIFQDSCRLFCS